MKCEDCANLIIYIDSSGNYDGYGCEKCQDCDIYNEVECEYWEGK